MFTSVAFQLAAASLVIVMTPAFANDREAIMNAIPPSAHAAVIVPNLKVLSDQITQCLEGMDRDQLLMGARPIDQFKAATGFNVGLNDTGSLAIALTRVEGGTTALVFIVPVTDAPAFLRATLTATPDGRYSLPGGKTVSARSLESHVAISESDAAIAAIGLGEQVMPLEQIVGDRGAEVAAQGDLFILIRKELLAGATVYLQAALEQRGLAVPGLAKVPMSVARDIDAAVLSLDFDPLGLVVRSFARFAPGSRASKMLGDGAPAAPQPLVEDLPDEPFTLAGSINLSALGDRTLLLDLCQQAGVELPVALIEETDLVQFAAYPSPAGAAGGLLNNALAVLRTAQPAAVVQAIKSSVLALQSDGPIRRQVKWTDDRAINESLAAAAFEVTTLDVPPQAAHVQAAGQLLFGRPGFRGFVKPRERSVLITFSQRPATLAAAMEVTGESGKPRGLAAQSALRSMRRWLPRTAALEAYINVGRLAQFASEAASAAPIPVDATLPEIDPALPPIAFGAGPAAGGAEHALVIPAGVLAAMFDHALRRMPGLEIPSDSEP